MNLPACFSKTPAGHELFSCWVLCWTPNAIFAGVGIVGTYITLISVWVGVQQVRVGVQQVGVGVEQVRALREQNEAMAETKAIGSTLELVECFAADIEKLGAGLTELHFLANTIAIGATAKDPSVFEQFSRLMKDSVGRLHHSHFAYLRLDFNPVGGRGATTDFDTKTKNALWRFYETVGIKDEAKINVYIDLTKILHRALREGGANYHPLSHADSHGPHFILLNAGHVNRVGIIWNISARVDSDGEVVTTGFRTTNHAIITTMLANFKVRIGTQS